jgi:hypothetical protein
LVFGTVTAQPLKRTGEEVVGVQELQNKVLSHRVCQNKTLPAVGVNTLRD